MATGLNVSKANVYAVLGPQDGLKVSKALVYAVIQPLDPGINVSKALVYAIVTEQAQATFNGALSDSLRAAVDSISAQLTRHRTASISDTLGVATDLLYPPPIDAVHFTGSLGDALQLISDSLAAHTNKAFVANITDTLQVIQEAIGAGKINLETPGRWVAPVAITPRVDTIDPIYLAAHPVLHPERYYSPKVKSYGTFTRAISAPVGFVKTGDCNLSLIDANNELRRALAPKTIRKADFELRLGPEGGKFFSFLRPMIREIGVVTQPGDGELAMDLHDFISDLLDEPCDAFSWSNANFADAILEVVEAMEIPDAAERERIYYDSFDETRAKVAALLCNGSVEEGAISWGELLTRLQRSSNIDLFCDKWDRVTIRYTADDDIAVVWLDDVRRLYKGTIRQSLAEPVANRLPYTYGGSEELHYYDNLEDQDALDGKVIEDEVLNMYFVSDAATAAAVIAHRAQWLDLNAFRIEGEVPLVPTVGALELAQIVAVTHFGGIAAGGYVEEQFKLLELSMDIDSLVYRFKGIRRRTPPPETISTPDIASGEAKINSRVGPYASNTEGELFAVFVDPDDQRHLRVITTQDFGAAWDPIDEAGSPTLTDNIASFDSYDDGTLVHCATQEETTGRVAYHTFSKTSKTWVTVDEEVVAAASNIGLHCVSIECRYPGGEPVIFFQGDRILECGNFWYGGAWTCLWYARGYYSIKTGGNWSTPVLVTPHPGTGADGVSSNCFVERVVAGRENRMHFFYQVAPAVTWVKWSPDEYCRTLQGDLTLGTEANYYATSVYYPAGRNMGDGCVFADRTKIATLLKGHWGAAEIDIWAEGPELQLLRQVVAHAQAIDQSNYTTQNPAGFVREHDGVLYAGLATFDGFVSLTTSEDEGATWLDPAIKAGPQFPPFSHVETLLGTVLKVRGVLYLSYFESDYDYHWLAVNSLPYTE